MLHFLERRDFLEILTAKKKFGGRIRVSGLTFLNVGKFYNIMNSFKYL